MARDIDGLTKKELYTILKRINQRTEFRGVKQMTEKVMSFLDDKCPECGAHIEHSMYVRTLREMEEYDVITLFCTKCGTVYRKREDKRKFIKGSLMDVIKNLERSDVNE